MTVLSIYPILIVLALTVGMFWIFALQRFNQRRGYRLLSIGLGLIGFTLAAENSYYLMARLVSPEYFIEVSYWEAPIWAMKSMYVVGLFSVLLAFGAIE